MIFIGIGGQLAWYFFGVIPSTQASFQEMQNVSGYMMILGFILLPAGLFKDGLPAPGHTAKVFLGVFLVLFVGIAFTAILVAPSASSTGPPPSPIITHIVIANGAQNPNAPNTYVPDTVTVVIGVNNTVQWTNDDPGSTHSITSSSGAPVAFDRPTITTGQTYTFTFTRVGTYPYHCTFHTWMTATIIVKQ